MLPATAVDRWERITHAGRVEASYGLDAGKAQHVSVGGRDIWLVPGTAGVCMLVPDSKENYATFSARNAVAMSGRFRVYRGSQTMIGLVPDPNKAIRLTTDGGAIVEAPVVNNMYTVTDPSGFRAFQVRDASGELRTFGSP